MHSDVIVYIVDDDAGIRHSMNLLMQSVELNTVSYCSGQEFLQRYDSSRPGCLVLDIRMPELSGLELMKKLVEQHIELPVIIVTGHGDTKLAVRAMKAGAIDFIEKPFNDQVLLDSVSRAIEKSIEMFKNKKDCADFNVLVNKLSAREREIMDLMVQGKTAKEVAVMLGISSKTVDVHRGHILNKMQVRSVPELVRLVVIHGHVVVPCELENS